ncbi:acetoacetate decarboxylase family protein [Pontimicrobium sp. IMCC45349]|uniref:acetoacetate decarboxylase family protein n=1 Tax=Pontimicrobium sp. IMCC45349 TaxID=3391574 RepID=UPI0039A2A0DE
MKKLISTLAVIIFICSSNLISAQKQGNKRQFSPEKILEFLDKNNDNKISKQEASRAKKLSENFEHLDTNKDGFLTLNELKSTNSSNKYTYLENDGIYMYYETKEEDIYRKLLPEVFDMPNRLFVYTFISDFYKMEGQTQPYKEASIFLLGKYKGEEIWHCVYMPVTSEESMRMGITRLGLPKTMGEINFSRSETVYSAILIDENENTMSLNINTKQYSFSEKETKELKELSIIPKMNILRGNVIKMSKKGNGKGANSNTSILDIAKVIPDRITIKEGKGEISLNTSLTQKNSNSVSALELKPSRIIGAYYMHNTIPFGLTGNSF